jgi:methyltransferase-like protein/SAM-dependent methyltransferase
MTHPAEPTQPGHTTYDDVPYPGAPYRTTHPNTMATLAALVGMTPAPVDRCRVLELGCSDGGNLLPMAFGLPGSQFVGLDQSAKQIESGQSVQQELGLKNVTLQQCDILEVQEQFGRFDYIVAHGVYSWVPAEVQERILALCGRLLNPHGVAFISYNTYPGWHMRGMVREMMLYRVRKLSDSAALISEARAFLDFLCTVAGMPEVASLTATDAAAYGAALRYEQNLLKQYQDTYVFHEHLEPINIPVYFSDFIGRAARHGLQYLSEADFVSAQIVNFPPAIVDAVRTIAADVVDVQQYLDFLSNRTFRQTLLCRRDVPLHRTPDPQALAPFHVASPIRPASDTPDLAPAKPETFSSHVGKSLTADTPIVKAVMMQLGEAWPTATPFETLLQNARERLDPGGPRVYSVERLTQDAQFVGTTLLNCFAQGVVELHIHPARFCTQISSTPAASPVARLQARTGSTVVNMRHEQVMLDDLSRQVLVYADGTHDRADVFNYLTQLVSDGVIVIQTPEGRPVENEEERQTQLAEALNRALQTLAGSALLVGLGWGAAVTGVTRDAAKSARCRTITPF